MNNRLVKLLESRLIKLDLERDKAQILVLDLSEKMKKTEQLLTLAKDLR